MATFSNPEVNSALLVVDMQNDFFSEGRLAVPFAEKILPKVNHYLTLFSLVAACQDWHPQDHGSFFSNHAGKKVFDKVTLGGVSQILWPEHCVAGTKGADFHPQVQQKYFNVIIRKGLHKECDSYSAFYDNNHRYRSGLHGFFQEMKVKTLYLCGLALDYCVLASAKDAASLGYKVHIFLDGTALVNEENRQQVYKEVQTHNITLHGETC